MPRHNSEYWAEKMARNRRRDVKVNSELTVSDWSVMRLWEHIPIAAAADMVVAAISENARQIGEKPKIEAAHQISGLRVRRDSSSVAQKRGPKLAAVLQGPGHH